MSLTCQERSDDDGHPFAIGLSTSDDDAADALSLVYDETSNTYTYDHTDLPDSGHLCIWCRFRRRPGRRWRMTCLLLGWGITSTPQLPRHQLQQ